MVRKFREQVEVKVAVSKMATMAAAGTSLRTRGGAGGAMATALRSENDKR